MCNYNACIYFRIWAALSLSITVCDVTSKMSADEELLLLSAAATAATISLVAFSCNLILTGDTITSQVRQHKYYVM